MRYWLAFCLLVGYSVAAVSQPSSGLAQDGGSVSGASQVFFPLLMKDPQNLRLKYSGTMRVNAPFFPDSIQFAETAIFWFGEITPNENYVDMRVGYTQSELYIHASVVDRYLWYDPAHQLADFSQWDSLSLYLAADGQAYRLDGQLSWWEGRSGYQAAYTWQGDGWQPANLPFVTESTWRGNAPNDTSGDRGWMMTFKVPFTSLGRTGAPSTGTVWKLGVSLHDRDEKNASPLPDKNWPVALQPALLDTWGELHFGLPTYDAPLVREQTTTLIRQGQNGAKTPDAAVGGSTTCGKGLDYWTEWPLAVDPQNEFINIQNQYDIADWPCFSRYYVTFPLDQIPSGKKIVSATLIMHQFGSSGGGGWGTPPPSWIQPLAVQTGWDEQKLSWNSSPLAVENFTGTWVQGLEDFPGWPGIAWKWDVSLAAAQAYQDGQSLHLALYSADSERHSGKYFVTADTPDWNKQARPALEIIWGEP